MENSDRESDFEPDRDVEKPESIDDTLKATLASINERNTDLETPETPATPEKPPKARDEAGKFAKVEQAKETAVAPAKDAKAPQIDATPATADPAKELTGRAGIDLNRPPGSWKPAAKAAWDKLDPAVRGEIYRREFDFMDGQAKLIPDAEMGRNLKAIAQPYQAMIDAEGGSIQGALQDYLKTASILRIGSADQKRNALLNIARTFGVDLGQPQIDPNASSQQQQYHSRDPRVDELISRFETEDQRRAAEAQQRAAAEKQQADRSVDGWVAEVDDKGQPKRPYLENVLSPMQEKIPSIRSAHPEWTHQQVLQEAYDRSCREDPEVSEVMFQQRLAAEQEKRREDNLQKVESAKRAAGVPSARRGGTPTTPPLGTMDDTLRETYRALQG